MAIKIAQIITRMDWGGSPDIFRLTCSYLDKQSYDLQIIIGETKHPTQKTRIFLERFSSQVVMVSQLHRDINLFYDFIAFCKLYRLFRKERFDVVHTHTAKAGALGRAAAYLAGVPVIIHTPHGHNFYGYFGKLFSGFVIFAERALAKITDKIIVLTRLEMDDFIKFKVVGPDKIALIPQGLEIDSLSEKALSKQEIKNRFGLSPDELLVGMIGRLEEIKGPDYFIEAALHLTDKVPQVKFILVGEGSLRRSIEEKVIRSGARADRFIFTGWQEDVSGILPGLDVLVLPSLNEAVGIVLLEAQACGVAVVASRVGGIPEVVRDHESGILVEPKDAKALEEAIIYLLQNKEARVKMGECGRQWVKGKFPAQDMVDKVSLLYQGLLTKKHAL